jgi:dihydrofolate reductase
MRKLVVSEFISVDGVVEDPGGSEKSARGGWAFRFNRGDEGDRFKLDEVMAAGALLLGRKTYEGFAAAWPGRTDEIGFAQKMNSMPKYVVSETLKKPQWSNTTVIAGDAVQEISRLKEQPGGDLLVNGSCDLVHTLIENNLVDELRLMVFPIVLGAGRRLFSDSPHSWPFRLLHVRAVGQDGVLIVTYEPKQNLQAVDRPNSSSTLRKLE